MTTADLPLVVAIGERVHPDHPEDPSIFAERLRLFPRGCLVLARANGLAGYVIAHPWVLPLPPKLDTLLLRLPDEPDTFYIHDLALLPNARGRGDAAVAIGLMAQIARGLRLPMLSLVAVGASPAFWGRQGFVPFVDETLRRSLASYGAAACFMTRQV